MNQMRRLFSENQLKQAIEFMSPILSVSTLVFDVFSFNVFSANVTERLSQVEAASSKADRTG